ncbi:Copper amine oxidase N-terminal domain-containing protein [Paenibacillus sophorae]|uniref:Copper amine oxidase N-terminal domain-containing protein n=1 Tax=Paenibacillus sophorae TaxID=1333845 RepID=A0A1H8MFY6_9BACL|nr:copper amine oxidase N-terminal domain-containing protein [Paenibacillus sophorae]QWU17798.1 copper amine oxidase N-terminal domain-containing protein [Paenibacillus sophorae]SEO16247.1 Copper amine oxidase N-terminal domain-containing protein [Paenibacillus sophorae]
MKLKAAALLLAALLIPFSPSSASASETGEVAIDWNGESVRTSVPSYIENGVTFVSIDMISKLNGLSASWLPDEGLARLWMDRGGVFVFKPGTGYADDMDKRYTLGAEIAVKNGVVMLPLRFIAEMAGADISWDQTNNKVSVIQKRMAVASVPGTRNRLFAISEDKGEYMGITLEWNGMLKSFPSWRNPSTVGSPPRLLTQDISGDGKPEAIILLNAGSGTGVYLEEPHVVNSRTFKEIGIQDPLEAARQRLVSGVERVGKDTVIRVMADGTVRERHLDKQESDGESPGGLTFGSIIKYEVRGGKLVAILAGAEGIENYLGEAVVTYILQNGAYTAKSVSFSFYQ